MTDEETERMANLTRRLADTAIDYKQRWEDIDLAFTNLHREYDRRGDRIEELEAKLAQQDDLVQAAVAAALREAINRVNGCDRVSEVQPAILALITPDAQAALDRVRAAERERAHNAGRKHERDLIYAFAQRMDTEGKAYAEQILAAIRKGGE